MKEAWPKTITVPGTFRLWVVLQTLLLLLLVLLLLLDGLNS